MAFNKGFIAFNKDLMECDRGLIDFNKDRMKFDKGFFNYMFNTRALTRAQNLLKIFLLIKDILCYWIFKLNGTLIINLDYNHIY